MGKNSSWRPRGVFKNKAKRPDDIEEEDGEKELAQEADDQQRKGAPLPKHCRGLIHVALCVAYTGIPFRGLQIQTHEHISHTVEGTLLLALKMAGYLLEEDFTPDGSRLRFDGGIKILTEEEAAAEMGQLKEALASEDITSSQTENGAEDPPTAVENGTDDGQVPKIPPHKHKRTIPPHLQHLSKRQLKKYDPCFNPDGKFQFSRSCRTDKGVHAVRNIVSLYLRERDWRRDGNERMAEKINKCIPIVDTVGEPVASVAHSRSKVMKVLAVTPVLPSFNAKECCNSRVYRYLIPLYALGFPANQNPTEDAYFNGSSIDDWERLYASYPEFLEKGKELARQKEYNAEGNRTAAATTWLTHPSELLRGHSAIVAEAAASDASSTSSGCESTTSNPFDHPIVRQLISYSNEFLHNAYVGPSRRFHNFSASAGDSEMRGASNAKVIRGDDSEASRSIRRCELAPCIVWLNGPNTSSSSSSLTIPPSGQLSSGTTEFLVGGNNGTAGIDMTNDPTAQLYNLKLSGWHKKSFVSSNSPPPLLPYVVFQVHGQSFLLNMIRKMVGFMLAIVRGGRPWWAPSFLAQASILSVTTDGGDDVKDEANDTLARRSAFMGYCRPSLVADPFEPVMQCQIPMAPGPYLSLLNSKYSAYDVNVKRMNDRNRRKALEALSEERKTDAANSLITCTTPYYQTDVFPLSESWAANKNAAQRQALGAKRTREEDVEDVASDTPRTDVQASAEEFYWRVIAHDITSWDCNIYLGDCDVMLALRDGRRTEPENGAVVVGSTLVDQLTTAPTLTTADAANAKLISKIKSQIPSPSDVPRAGEMTTFLRSLRIHSWNVRRDEKVAARLAQQQAAQMENKAQRVLMKDEKSKQQLASASTPTLELPDTSATASDPTPTFETKAQLRRKWQLQRSAQDSKAVEEMIAARRQGNSSPHMQTTVAQDARIDSGLVSSNDDDAVDDARLLDSAVGDGATPKTNNSIAMKVKQQTNDEEGDADPFDENVHWDEDDGWWYYGLNPEDQRNHRLLYYEAMDAIVADRKSRKWWQV